MTPFCLKLISLVLICVLIGAGIHRGGAASRSNSELFGAPLNAKLLLGGAGYTALPDTRRAQTTLAAADGEDQWSLLAQSEQEHSCITAEQEQAIRQKIAEYHARVKAPAAAAQTAPQPFPFYPQAGTVGQDLFISNYVDLDPGAGLLDWDCTRFTYNGHNGEDSVIRTFREQEIGVPVFAALDGVVIDANDGEPDMNTSGSSARGNLVILDHGGRQNTVYAHLKRGSVAVRIGQAVKAGTQLGLTASSGNSTGPHLHFGAYLNGELYEPFAGPCRSGASNWKNQAPIRRDPYLRDLFFSNVSLTGGGREEVLLENVPRTGAYVLGAGQVMFRAFPGSLPANSSFRIRFRRPDNSIAREAVGQFNNSETIRSVTNSWSYTVSLNVIGEWRLQLEINNETVADAPFRVVASENEIINHPPNAVSVTIDPPIPQAGEVVFCRVNTSLLFEDPDYDIVRYRYEWRVNGAVVRDVTSAALSDAIPKDLARNGDQLTCTVTPSDGRLSGPAATASARYGASALTAVSAASYDGARLAAESIVAAFGTGLATTTQAATTLPLPTNLAGTIVRVRDSAGVERQAPLFFVSPTQINFQIPPGVAPGSATITITSGAGFVSAGTSQIAVVAPGLFTADASGEGLPAASVLRVRADGSRSNEPVARFDPATNKFVAVPIDLGPATDQVFLILYGTGLRNRGSLSSVTVAVGGVNAPVSYAGAQGSFVGLDQVNALLPRMLIGRGEADVVISIDGQITNTVKINLK
jgi:uncharacterized protein (TIGR03437 family)